MIKAASPTVRESAGGLHARYANAPEGMVVRIGAVDASA
jgi:hypothetical protein